MQNNIYISEIVRQLRVSSLTLLILSLLICSLALSRNKYEQAYNELISITLDKHPENTENSILNDYINSKQFVQDRDNFNEILNKFTDNHNLIIDNNDLFRNLIKVNHFDVNKFNYEKITIGELINNIKEYYISSVNITVPDVEYLIEFTKNNFYQIMAVGGDGICRMQDNVVNNMYKGKCKLSFDYLNNDINKLSLHIEGGRNVMGALMINHPKFKKIHVANRAYAKYKNLENQTIDDIFLFSRNRNLYYFLDEIKNETVIEAKKYLKFKADSSNDRIQIGGVSFSGIQAVIFSVLSLLSIYLYMIYCLMFIRSLGVKSLIEIQNYNFILFNVNRFTLARLLAVVWTIIIPILSLFLLSIRSIDFNIYIFTFTVISLTIVTFCCFYINKIIKNLINISEALNIHH